MANEEFKQILTRQLQAFNAQTVAEFDWLADEYCSASYVLHDPSLHDFGIGPEPVKQFMHSVVENAPDVHIVLEDLIGEGDKVAARFSVHSTKRDTGKPEITEVMGISRFAGGKIVEEWQLGVPVSQPESLEDNKKTIQRWYEATNTHDLSLIDLAADEIFAPDYFVHDDPDFQDLGCGPETMKKMMRQIIKDYPDLHIALDDVMAVGDQVAYRGEITGMHSTTGETLRLQMICMSRFAGDKRVEEWAVAVPLPTPMKA
jgi:predicted SnoaL-like aldol condensation-catalyzing enzyme